MFRKAEGIRKRIEELGEQIRLMEATARLQARRYHREKRDHDKANKKLAKELAKEEKKAAKLEELLDLERLAELEHDQWVAWSQAVADEVSEERRARWETCWIPYSELSEEIKEHDRIWARKILEEK